VNDAYGTGTGDDEADIEGMRGSAPIEPPAAATATATAATQPKPAATPDLATAHVGSSTELIELHQGKSADAPLCLTCGTKMRPAGSCYVCEGCGSTSGCQLNRPRSASPGADPLRGTRPSRRSETCTVRTRRPDQVRWLGGGSGAGKSTVARLLAQTFGVRVYSTDATIPVHGAQAGPDAPLLAEFRGAEHGRALAAG